MGEQVLSSSYAARCEVHRTASICSFAFPGNIKPPLRMADTFLFDHQHHPASSRTGQRSLLQSKGNEARRTKPTCVVAVSPEKWGTVTIYLLEAPKNESAKMYEPSPIYTCSSPIWLLSTWNLEQTWMGPLTRIRLYEATIIRQLQTFCIKCIYLDQ